ncbi:MAG: DUF6048 family protein [Bacteroides sp.]
MRHKIFRYFSATAIVLSISFLFLFSIVLPCVAQQPSRPTQIPKRDQKKNKKEEVKPDTIPLFNGAYVGVDVFGVGSNFFGSDFLSSEVSLVANLKNKFLPTVELGYGSTDTWNETGIHYKSSAPYFRIGIDYNTMAKKKNSYLFVGVRYGMSSFKYDIHNLPADDPIWGDAIPNPSFGDEVWGNESVPFDHRGLKCTMQWFELVAGVKVQVFKSFSMGWAIRMKYKLSASMNEHADPWYVPGFGKYQSNTIGVTYSLIYQLPFKTK